jgi:hypothetical protein
MKTFLLFLTLEVVNCFKLPSFNLDTNVENVHDQIRGYDANLALLRWFFQHSQVAGGWIKFDYLAKSDGEIAALKAAVPDLGNPLRDLNSFRTILYHLSSHQRFTDEQVVQIGTLIVGWSPQAMDVLKSYIPAEPPNSKGYTLLLK